MRNKLYTYSKILKPFLLMAFVFAFNFLKADNTQTLTSLTLQSIKSGAGDASTSIVYNSLKNEYFAVYSDFDPSCSSKQKLYGVIVNAITGLATGPGFPISACDKKASDPQVIFNSKQNEYAIVYKSSEGAGTKILFQIVDATNYSLKQNIELASKSLGDPYENNSIHFSSNVNIYSVGFHEIISSTDTKLKINYINSSTKTLAAYSSLIDKNAFAPQNDGVKHAQLLNVNGNLFSCFELKLTSGSEIWGGLFNPSSGQIINSYFQISPSPTGEIKYINPSPTLNTTSNEILVVYEKSHLQITTASLNEKIRAQKINGNTGVRISPNDISVTNLPTGLNPNEDAKFPSVVYSSLSDEFMIFFYGDKWINADNNYYDTYLQRVNTSDLSPIGTQSTLVIEDIGTAIVDNNTLRRLGFAHNTKNNQFLLGWNTVTTNIVQSQIWRYNNNLPGNPAVSTLAQNENIPIGSTFATLTASDPDPEDANLTFSFGSGVGGEDNSYFTISGNTLKVAKNLNFEESSTRKIKVKVTDSHGKTTEKPFVLTINNINEKPTNLSLSGTLSVEENAPVGTFTSIISVVDEDFGETHTYTLVAGDSAEHNSNFSINPGTNILKLTKELNYEATPKQFVRIMATDNGGSTEVKGFMIQVIDINEKPEDLALSTSIFPENDLLTMASVEVIDPDFNSNYSAVLTSGVGDDDNNLFAVENNKLKPRVALNFEAKSSYSVRIKASDGIYDTSKQFTITVKDENDKPDSIEISKTKILTGQDAGTIVGYLTTYDQDLGDTHIYQLIEGGSVFFITGSELRISSSLIYDELIPENNFYSIKIRSTDLSDGIKEEYFQIEVVQFIDEIPPEINGLENVPDHFSENASSFKIDVNVSDNEKLDKTYFYCRKIRSTDQFEDRSDLILLDAIDQKLMQVEVNLSADLMDEMGLEYYFKIIDAYENETISDTSYLYKTYISKLFEPTARTYNGTLESYKIIANPFDLEPNKISVIFSDYESSTKDTWRLFNYDNGKPNEVGNTPNLPLTQGKGYWFNKSKELSQPISFDKAPNPKYNKAHPFQMVLKQGWNMIGNPYPFEINWDDVIIYNNITDEPMELNIYNGSYKTTITLKEFEGALVWVENPKSIKIPLHNLSESGGRIANKSESGEGWLVSIAIDNGKSRNELGGLGMHTQADGSYDYYDRPLLPRFIKNLDISFNHPEHFAKAFSRDVVDLQDNHIWEFVAATNYDENKVTLSWNAHDLFDSPNMLILYDVLNDKIIDMKATSQYKITLNQSAPFKALYGNEVFIKDALSKIKTQALTPYPNPFNQLVSFPINLPFSTNKYNIECGIYNLMGKKVFERKIENIESGLFSLDWDEEQTKMINQGIYIYSIKVTNGFLTNNFHGRIVKN